MVQQRNGAAVFAKFPGHGGAFAAGFTSLVAIGVYINVDTDFHGTDFF
ncbi:MAG TPA: hypothetical protein VG603_14980 [Chitinophagales bacterium]|nr:hypothetical protein [Chitinophagales bacterium]